MVLREIGCKVVEWMHLPQDRDKWRTFVNTVMNLWVPQETGILYMFFWFMYFKIFHIKDILEVTKQFH